VRIKFSVKALEGISPHSAKKIYAYDTDVRGLVLEVTPNGNKTFQLYRWAFGRPMRIKLGLFGEISIDAVRRMAAEKIAMIAQGQNPQLAKQEARAEPTFGELFAAYIEKYKKPRRPKSWEQDQNNYDLHLAGWKARRLSEVTRDAVAALSAKVGAKHPYLANRLLALISTMFNQIHNIGIAYDGPNPAKGVQKWPEQKREKYIAPDAMPKFFAALDELRDEATADFFRIALFTGQRRANVQGMRWDQIDLDRGLWVIPDTKANRPHTVPLVAEAVAVLRRLRKATDGPWVFPSPFSESGHIVEPKKAWKAVLTKAGLTGLRLHDLRHTLASWQAAAGTSLAIIGKGLGHTQVSTTQRYAHLDSDPVREAMSRAIKGMTDAGNKKKKSP